MNPKKSEAELIIRNHTVFSMGAGLIPIPMLDLAAVTAVQLDMLRQIFKLYDVDFNENQGKAWVAALTGSSLARFGAGMIKIIPGLGSLVGGFAMSVLSGASTYAVGEVALSYLSGDQTIFNVDIEEVKIKYEEAFEKGKKKAKEWKEAAKDTADNEQKS